MRRLIEVIAVLSELLVLLVGLGSMDLPHSAGVRLVPGSVRRERMRGVSLFKHPVKVCGRAA